MSKHDSRHRDLRLSATNYLEGKGAPVPAEQTAAFFAQHVVQLIDEIETLKASAFSIPYTPAMGANAAGCVGLPGPFTHTTIGGPAAPPNGDPSEVK